MKKGLLPFFFLLIFILGGCTPAAPRVDIDQLSTIAAATVDAVLSATHPATSQPTASDTPMPTGTPVPQETPTAEITAAVPSTPGMNLKIVYSDGQGNLWFWQSSADPLQLTTSADVLDFALSPDGSCVFFARGLDYASYSLWLIDTDGSDERPVMSAADFDALPRPAQAIGTAPTQLGWVPDSTTAAFATYHFFDGPGFAPGNDLRLVNGATGVMSTLLEPGEAGGMYFYSPDGARIALVTPNQIDLINSDGSNRRTAVLEYEDVFMYTESPFYAEPVWSADGSLLRVIIPAKDRLGNPDEPNSVWEIPADGGDAVKLLDFYVKGLGPDAAISPDLQKLVYFQNSVTGGQYDLHIASLDGTVDEVYASGSLNWRGWTDDSQRFVWTLFGELGTERKTYLGELGSEAVQLGAPQVPHILEWVTGDRFLFLENTGSTPPAWKLYLGTVGLPNQLLAELAAGNQIPQFEFVK